MELTNYLSMKELPEGDRPYEKLERLGARVLSDAELLSVIIGSGTKTLSALQLSQQIMSEAGERGLMLLEDYSLEELRSISGIGRVKALQIKAVLEIGSRTIDKARMSPRKQIRTPDDARSMLEEQLRYVPREELHMIMMDVRNRVIRTVRLSEGGLSSAVIKPRDLFREAVRANAYSVILAHNHPSGDASPSQDDIDSTNRLIEIGRLMGINVVDHLVISLSGFISMKQNGLI